MVSAEKIFFRDGFELAQIDAIAADAGRTRGAVYAQFKSKESLFLSVLERRMTEIEELGKDFIDKETAGEPGQSLQAFKRFYTMLYRPDWAILNLEFMLYGLRHPESMKKLKTITRKVWDSSLHAGLQDAAAYKGQSNIRSRIAALTPLVSGIVLEMHWEPELMTAKQARLILGEVFDGLFPAPFPEKSAIERSTRDGLVSGTEDRAGSAINVRKKLSIAAGKA